jgi:hypothetical protein
VSSELKFNVPEVKVELQGKENKKSKRSGALWDFSRHC